ncbi:MAG TPA: DUF1906 domain-containing protein [Bacillales bacterium]|nr:DUF1906 domain-containing protein [Bacillales bacterium]
MDTMVLLVQQWVNETYGGRYGYEPAPETGKTGWLTMYSLTRALQIELGIGTPANNFGDGTSSAYIAWGEMELGSVPTDEKGQNIVRILQGSMFCKGYGPGGFTGTFGEGTKAAVIKLQTDAGLPIRDGKVYDYVFRAFLTMDAYVLTSGGDPRIREMQRDLNYNYFTTSGVQPADGHYQRGTNRALIYGIQTEEGIAPELQTGSVGPTTRDRLPTLMVGSRGDFVKLFQYALYVNGFDSGVFDGIYGTGVKNTVINFQNFVRLTPDGIAGKQTWLSTLVSTGDPTRKGTACDCITEITPARAQALKNAGYKTVGRYLTNASPTGLNKKIQPGELDNIFATGLTVFPIYQTIGSSASYFNPNQGALDAIAAMRAANDYGFGEGTTIYFAVDFDALDYQITENIIPHFQAINNKMRAMGSKYNIGVYGPRNVCIRVGNNGYSTKSFVSGMSNGFSGNLGYPLPKDWAFDQISTISVGSGEGYIEIDNNIQSGRDNGAGAVYPPTEPIFIDDDFFNNLYEEDWRRELTIQMDEDRTFWQWFKGDPFVPGETIPIAVDNLLNYDELITNLSRTYSLRKALIQSVLFSEMSLYGVDDTVSDALVQSYYNYCVQLEQWESLSPEEQAIIPPPTPPAIIKKDGSTGLGQIFARTAINAINFAVGARIIQSETYDSANWKDMMYVWENLHNDNIYNIKTCALVLIHAALDYLQLNDNYYEYNENEIKSVLARYNGTDDRATQYGERVYKLYQIFEKYNKIIREQ